MLSSFAFPRLKQSNTKHLCFGFWLLSRSRAAISFELPAAMSESGAGHGSTTAVDSWMLYMSATWSPEKTNTPAENDRPQSQVRADHDIILAKVEGGKSLSLFQFVA